MAPTPIDGDGSKYRIFSLSRPLPIRQNSELLITVRTRRRQSVALPAHIHWFTVQVDPHVTEIRVQH